MSPICSVSSARTGDCGLGPISSAQYRLHGIQAKPEQARQQLDMHLAFDDPDYIDSVDIAYNFVPLQAAAIPLWAVYDRLIPWFSVRSALRTYI